MSEPKNRGIHTKFRRLNFGARSFVSRRKCTDCIRPISRPITNTFTVSERSTEAFTPCCARNIPRHCSSTNGSTKRTFSSKVELFQTLGYSTSPACAQSATGKFTTFIISAVSVRLRQLPLAPACAVRNPSNCWKSRYPSRRLSSRLDNSLIDPSAKSKRITGFCRVLDIRVRRR